MYRGEGDFVVVVDELRCVFVRGGRKSFCSSFVVSGCVETKKISQISNLLLLEVFGDGKSSDD